MKSIFDTYCYQASKNVTKTYSTSFYSGVSKLDKKIRNDVHAIYGMVRFADEIVDSFHDFDKEYLLAYSFKNYIIYRTLSIYIKDSRGGKRRETFNISLVNKRKRRYIRQCF